MILRLGELSFKKTTIDLGPVEISEGQRLSFLMIGWTICPPEPVVMISRNCRVWSLTFIKQGYFDECLQFMVKSSSTPLMWKIFQWTYIYIYTSQISCWLNSTIPLHILPDFCSINRYPPVIPSCQTPLHLNHRLIRICILCPVTGVLLRKNRWNDDHDSCFFLWTSWDGQAKYVKNTVYNAYKGYIYIYIISPFNPDFVDNLVLASMWYCNKLMKVLLKTSCFLPEVSESSQESCSKAVTSVPNISATQRCWLMICGQESFFEEVKAFIKTVLLVEAPFRPSYIRVVYKDILDCLKELGIHTFSLCVVSCFYS